jgi:hypothetical protein
MKRSARKDFSRSRRRCCTSAGSRRLQRFSCHLDGGVAKSLLVAPGHRKIAISLPGYQTFNTEIDLAPNQKFQLKTNLIKEGATQPFPQQ